MAGVGFALEHLTRGRTLTSTAGAYVCGAFLVAGPWLFTIIGIAAIGLVACPQQYCPGVPIFRSVFIYNSLFSSVLGGPIAFVCTRFVSDRICEKRYESITFAFVAALFAFAVLATALAGPFYLFATTLSSTEKLYAFQNLMLMGAAWLLVPFLGALRSYVTVTLAFGLGAVVMVGSLALAPSSEPAWLLNALNLGLCATNLPLLWRITREYGLTLVPDIDLLRTGMKYWELPLLGLTCSAGLWGDKLVMWAAAPTGTVRLAGGFQTVPNYDTPMFWAQLTAIPVLAVFFVQVETNFFRLCRAFYGSLRDNVSRRELMQIMSRLSEFVAANLRGLFMALSAVCALAILVSFAAIEPLGLRASQMGVLRCGLIGMVFHTSATFCLIFLLYFDLRRPALVVSTTYLVCNTGLTAALLPLGFPFFGYGNMLAANITFLVALGLLMRELPWLHFHAFVTNNTSLR